MKRTAKTVLAAIAVAGVTFGVSACSPSAPSEADGPLTVWVMGDSGANFETLVADSGIEVEVVAIPWDAIDEKLTTAVASGSGPDVLQIGLSKLATFAEAGALLPLDDLIADYPGLAPENFPAGVAGNATAVGGQMVSIPWVSDTRVLFTRTDILAENGIDAPPATWDELRADAKVLAARGEGQYGYYIPQWDAPLPIEMTWSMGGEVVDADGNVNFDTPEFNAAVDVYTGLYADGSVPTNSDFDQTQGFISGIAPMLVSGPYLGKGIQDAAPELDGKWQASPLPAGDGGSISLFAGSNLGVWFNTDQQEQSLKLLEYVSQPEQQLAWYGLTGELPTVTSALEDEGLNADPNVKVYTDQLATAKVLPIVAGWDGIVGTGLLDALNAIVLTGADRDESLATFYAAVDGLKVQ
ncbi:extracellular solute-binding protein [Leifsonia sp. H3M29-4]|uniref:extracellular solute-binding protein n=1 Tax=Salinibacterium metalliresistens TaxID=3031321 RepID=UPI0023DB19AA|nr:extracellular solute-binding protein [Salinibacterium metalliresistens]MDF1478099.1 extracellular solute-binding protein [Salinibacterium metalliresistens]